MLRGRCIEHGLAIGPDGGCVLCRRERGADSSRAHDQTAGAQPPSTRDVPASSLSPAVMQSAPPSAPPSKPIVIPSLRPDEGDPVVVRVPPIPMAFLGLGLIAGVAFAWSRLGERVSLFPRVGEIPAMPAPASAAVTSTPKPSVTLYSRSACPECDEARRYLNEGRIPFVEWDVDHDPDARARFEAMSPGRILPTFDVGGTVIEGFAPPRIAAAIRGPGPR